MQNNEKGWTEVKRKKKSPQKEKSYSQKIQQKSYNRKPVKHYWRGFDVNGAQLWFLEFDNKNTVSSKDSNYSNLLKKFLY